MIKLVAIRPFVALQEEVLRLVDRNDVGTRGHDLGRAMVAGLQHALRTEHLEALIVAVGGATRRMNLRQFAADGAKGDCRRIGIAGQRGDGRIGEGAGGGIHGFRFFAEDPAEDVEVVNQHVLEDAARTLQVFDRRRTWIATDDRQRFQLADFALFQTRLERGEGRIEAALEADQTSFSGRVDDLLALARPAEFEVDRLLAEDMLAGSGGALDEVGVGVGRRADEHGVNATVGKDLFDRDDFRPEHGGELRGRFRNCVRDACQRHAGIARRVRCMNLADAASADDCQTDSHDLSPREWYE